MPMKSIIYMSDHPFSGNQVTEMLNSKNKADKFEPRKKKKNLLWLHSHSFST